MIIFLILKLNSSAENEVFVHIKEMNKENIIIVGVNNNEIELPDTL